MRELLEQWARLEPDKCEKGSVNIFTIQAGPDAKNIYYPDNLNSFDLSWLQFAVQSAIVERGWSFELDYKPDVRRSRSYEADVKGYYNPSQCSKPAEALLEAYLAALESEVKR